MIPCGLEYRVTRSVTRGALGTEPALDHRATGGQGVRREAESGRFAEEYRAVAEAASILTRIGLTPNESKTRICHAQTEPFDFLGYSFGIQYSFGSGQPYMAAYPSKRSVRRIKDKLRRMIGSRMAWQSADNLVGDVNRVMRGWLKYFSYGTLWKTSTRLERFLQQRVRGWLVHKHKVGCRGECRYPPSYIYEPLGLVNPNRVLKNSRKPSGGAWSESGMRANRTSGSVSGRWKRGMV
jgi:hypothetical protein